MGEVEEGFEVERRGWVPIFDLEKLQGKKKQAHCDKKLLSVDSRSLALVSFSRRSRCLLFLLPATPMEQLLRKSPLLLLLRRRERQ